MERISGHNVYQWEEVTADTVKTAMHGVRKVKHKDSYYYNCPCAFDIETSSISRGDMKMGVAYLWQYNLNGVIIYGRSLEDYVVFCSLLVDTLHLSDSVRLVTYVHNLGYEFQWIRNYFGWEQVFARETHKPMKAVTTDGMEYRCSYILSGYSLAKVAENLTEHKIGKLVGELDYTKTRTPDTDITSEELRYAVHDVIIVEYYIAEEIKRNGGKITQIPLTQTGYVRRYCKQKCLDSKNRKQYRAYRTLMEELTIEPDEYVALKSAFAGGHTHANARHVGEVCEDITSYDFASSYPAVMVAEQYPMSKGVKMYPTFDEYTELIKTKHVIAQLRFHGVMLREDMPDAIISRSKCTGVYGEISDNGRIVLATGLELWCTELDYNSYMAFYDVDLVEVGGCWVYDSDYLPTPFVGAVLDLYKDKTALKGVEGKEAEYMHAKQMLNSCYGMTVTDILPEEVTYDAGEWSKAHPASDALDVYNNKKGRFLYYPWGVYVTAYARRNLYLGILSAGGDYRYADTDSVKIANADRHTWWIDAQNHAIIDRLDRAMAHHGFDPELTRVKDKKGRPRQLGIWDYDGHYDRFKTLGAKRYLVEEDGKYHLTVAGCGKKVACNWFVQTAQKRNVTPFELFQIGCIVPAGSSGRMVSTYIDMPMDVTVTDYQGNTGTYYTPSALHLGEVEYSFSASADYLEFLAGIRGGANYFEFIGTNY